MSDKISKNDFIEIEFTAKLKDGDIFDSNIKEDLEKLHAGHSHPINAKPLIFSIGNHMFVEGIDEYLIGKETNKTYNIELSPEKAFGKRNPRLIKIIPLSAFKTQKYQPQPGMTFNFDGQMAKILSVSGGRIITDFNNPLAGKEVVYNIHVKKKVTDVDEKVKALNDFLFQQEFKFKINQKDKKITFELNEKQKPLQKFLELFNDKFKEIIGYDINVEVSSNIRSSSEKKENKANSKK